MLPFGRLLARLSVSRKLMLIYLLDLTAVIFVSSVLINEKFIAIDFARKEPPAPCDRPERWPAAAPWEKDAASLAARIATQGRRS